MGGSGRAFARYPTLAAVRLPSPRVEDGGTRLKSLELALHGLHLTAGPSPSLRFAQDDMLFYGRRDVFVELRGGESSRTLRDVPPTEIAPLWMTGFVGGW